ncbi:MAG: hypothetical protein IT285_04175 [Bdellovibrionales bacterium]|nr:hypothetical protein [Bdellovibrionales bacterium]
MAVIPLLLPGCMRSQSYVNDRAYSDEGARSYYSKPGSQETPAERVEMLGQPKKKVVVFNFWNDTPVQAAEIGAFAADELRRGLFLTERVILPLDIKAQLETEEFLQGDKVKVAQLVREGRRLGVSVVVIGRISKLVFRQRGDDVGILRQTQSLAAAEVEIKVFDVQAGREIMSLGRSGESSSNALVAFEKEHLQSPEYRAELSKLAVREAMGGAVNGVVKAVEKMSWQGRVARLAGKKVYVNAGRASGIVSGDILRVTTPGDDIYDPTSGAFLGTAPGQVKGTLEVIDFIGEDGAVANVHTGGNFQEGDTVRLY